MAAPNLHRPGPDAFASDAATGATLPFLPTLAVAAVIALCAVCADRPAPTAAVPTLASAAPHSVGDEDFAPRRVLAETSPAVPATLAFARYVPLTIEPEAPRTAPARLARTVRSRPACPGARCAAPAAIAADHLPDVAAIATEPVAAEDTVLPGVALPFAPTIRLVKHAAGFVGLQAMAAKAEALALGDAVVEIVGGMR